MASLGRSVVRAVLCVILLIVAFSALAAISIVAMCSDKRALRSG